MRLHLLLAAAVALLPLPLRGQEAVEGPADYAQAMAYLSAGDTAAAIVWLRDVVEEEPDFGPAFLRLGSLLATRASEVEGEFGQRSEAEKLLERAFRLMGSDPEVLLEYGLLLRKKQMRVDAKRVLDRAWQAAVRQGETFAPDQRARLHLELGKIYETWWEDWQGLVQIPPAAAGIRCSRVEEPRPHYETAVACPEFWHDQLQGVIRLADHKSEERARMLDHFRLALEADPGLMEAAGRLLGHLADAGEWAEYEQVSAQLVRRAPDDPRTHLFRGLGLHERGRVTEADAAFGRALALLPAEERRVFTDVGPLLTSRGREEYLARDSAGRAETARMVFTGKDPLFLTEASERRLEHYARLAWAELKFSAPASGLRGWDSDRGRIWVRYGPPADSYQCCYGGQVAGSSSMPGADGLRYVYWSYGRQGPLFTFSRNVTYRRARFTDPAGELAQALEATSPELYRPRTITTLHPLPHQAARFRGAEGDLTRIELYAAPPLDSLFAAPGSRLETGVFTFLADYTPVWEQRRVLDVSDRPLGLTYRFEVPPGRFRYGIEARLTGPDSLIRPAARAREALNADGFPPGRLAISDLLLTVSPVIAATEGPTRRDQLVLAPLRGTTLAAGDPIHLYFEIYGLEVGASGVAAYRAELAVEDSTERNVAQRLLRAGRQLAGAGAEETRVSWERQMRVEDDLVPEFLSVEVPSLAPGQYVVRVRITDVATGRSAERIRPLSVEEEP